MRNTKRFFISLFITIFTMSMLAGCGGTTAATSGTTAATESKDKEPVVIDSNGEGAVQGGIKSDEEIAALQEEEAAFAAESEAAESNQPAEFEDNSGHEPEAYGSGNFQDYWEGEDYFDLIAYMTDNGYEWHMAYDSAYNHVEDGDTAAFYEFRDEDTHKWRVVVGRISDIQVTCDGYKPTYYLVANDEHQVRIDDTGMTISEDEIISLNTIIQAISVNYNEPDPLIDTGLTYNTM